MEFFALPKTAWGTLGEWEGFSPNASLREKLSERMTGDDCAEPNAYGINWDFLQWSFLPVGVAQENAGMSRDSKSSRVTGALSADIYFFFAVIYGCQKEQNCYCT